MKKDGVTWVGCLLLFGAGAVWSPLFIDIYVQSQSVIDVLAKVATIIGVCFAAYIGLTGLGIWRKQAVATQDHELARAGLVALYQFRNAIRNVRNPFISAAEMDLDKIEGNPSFVDKTSMGTIRAYDKRFNNVWKWRSELSAHLVECEAIWNSGIKEIYEPVFGLQHQLFTYVELYCNTISPYVSDELRESYQRTLDHRQDILYSGADDAFGADLDAAIETIAALYRAKLVPR